MIDSREFLAARAPRRDRSARSCRYPHRLHRRPRLQRPRRGSGTALDKVRAKHPDMVLLHGGSPKGAERIAACWADNRKVPQIVFKPDWARTAKPHRSSATTGCSKPCRSASSSSRDRGFPPISPTRRGSSASRRWRFDTARENRRGVPPRRRLPRPTIAPPLSPGGGAFRIPTPAPARLLVASLPRASPPAPQCAPILLN